jgi:hypothetical protein
MLSGPWAESTRRKIPLPDDDPDAFELVLGLLNAHKNPCRLVSDQKSVLALAVLCDKYDLVAKVLQKWLIKTLNDDKLAFTPEERLHVAWVFGLRRMFEAAFQELAQTSTFCSQELRVHKKVEHLSRDTYVPLEWRQLNIAILYDGAKGKHAIDPNELEGIPLTTAM